MPEPKDRAQIGTDRAEPEGLPSAPAPQGSYVPALVHEGLVLTAGMTPRRDGALRYRGLVGVDLDLAAARAGAALAAGNALAAAATAAGGLTGIARCLRMTVFVACADDFTELSAVADGASDALVGHLGADQLPVRTAVGVRALPAGAPVEVELSAALRQH